MSNPPQGADAADTWSRRYAGEAFLFGTDPNAWLREHASAIAAGGRVLCVADGEGRNSVWLARQGFRVEAFDIAGTAVAKARGLAAREEGVIGLIAHAAALVELGDHDARAHGVEN